MNERLHHAASCPGRMAQPVSRREVLRNASNGFGLLALSSLMADRSYAGLSENLSPHAAPRAKNVIFCFMAGGVSHVDTFDPKPALAKHHGQLVQEWKDAKKTQTEGDRKWKQSPWSFAQYGQCGMTVSELFPHLAGCVDEMAFIHSMVAPLPLHAAGNLFIHSGRLRAGAPSLGSWATYGLGSENQNLPGFVLLESGKVPPGGRENFSNGYLPANYQATPIQAAGVPVANIVPADVTAGIQRKKLDLLLQQDQQLAESLGGHDGIESAIRNYEMAYRMQTEIPDVLDLSRESPATLDLYGVNAEDEHLQSYATQCLRARRLIEAGVRFVEITANPVGLSVGSWDQHGELKEGHEKNALVTDQPIAGLIRDLRQRGLLDETLILFASEMGRTPHTGNEHGRDHHVGCFTVWLAGGGIRGGTAFGVTDELGMAAVENAVTVHDLHATILHLLGLDHERLTYRYGCRDMSLTDVHGRVVHEILG